MKVGTGLGVLAISIGLLSQAGHEVSQAAESTSVEVTAQRESGGTQLNPITPNGYHRRWWKEAVVYQVYPRSFQDSNGDGIGDIKGLTSRLDYIQKLGVTVIWLSPHYDSPNADNGYDIRDYRKVMAEFGTMDDFDTLLKEIKRRRMKLILDLVVNHSSDEHHWFVESRKSKYNPYREYYIWKPGKGESGSSAQPGNTTSGPPKGQPNNWPSFFSGSAWKLDPATNEYYLHLFAEKQPDLNWENPKLRDEVYGLMKFWLDKGVDGFRMDVIPFISKDQKFPDLSPAQLLHPEFKYAMGPKLHDYLQEMNTRVLSKYDVMTVGEAFGVTPEQMPSLIDERRHELNLVFNFDAVRINQDNGRAREWTLPELKAIYDEQDRRLDVNCWNTLFLSNHDNPRLVSSFGDDSEAFRVRSAKLVATMLFTLKGTPFVYQGDELGMTNFPFRGIEDFNDIAVINAWKEKVEPASGKPGTVDKDLFLANMRKTSRDNARTPMQWDGSSNAGFSSGQKTWLPVNPNFREINAARQVSDPASVYGYYHRMIAIRHNLSALVYGDFKDLDPAHKAVFAYTRTLGSAKLLVLLNFSGNAVDYLLPEGMKPGTLILDNVPQPENRPGAEMKLAPWEARIYRQ